MISPSRRVLRGLMIYGHEHRGDSRDRAPGSHQADSKDEGSVREDTREHAPTTIEVVGGHCPDQQVADERHEAHCDDEMPKVPADCLMTGSSNEPASRPDASRNCADHPEAGSDPSESTRKKVQRLCGEKTSRRVRRALGGRPQVQGGSTRHQSNKHVCVEK